MARQRGGVHDVLDRLVDRHPAVGLPGQLDGGAEVAIPDGLQHALVGEGADDDRTLVPASPAWRIARTIGWLKMSQQDQMPLMEGCRRSVARMDAVAADGLLGVPSIWSTTLTFGCVLRSESSCTCLALAVLSTVSWSAAISPLSPIADRNCLCSGPYSLASG